MIIYGTAILAACVLVGKAIGTLLGQLLGVDADVGGVGFAMIVLLLVTGWLRSRRYLPRVTERGVLFWSGIYIPIVVAMAMTQNVRSAVDGGVMAIAAGVVVLIASLALVPAVAKIGPVSEPLPPLTDKEDEEA
ncbi:malonate transporter subunit MadL [Corynebacterium kalidii]|jgi:malonate transporter MadL subunit|uniref:Malonate transporter subunit MadL n=1 Tax=Corynebacterium kalidii TaxID=2931982 RepID=A0A9X1WH64_9CORY|nr:malonate transporter subunit MadL [Corynebacterium kalidii]MCJ7858393.1 malonate transporter subunit MadL [Corynebacterium kalidii]